MRGENTPIMSSPPPYSAAGAGPYNAAGAGAGPYNAAGAGAGPYNAAGAGAGPYNAAGAGAGRRFSSDEVMPLLLPGRQRSLSMAGLPPYHYYQSLPEVTVVLADTESAPLSTEPQRMWKDMSSSLRRKDSITARLGLERTNWCGIFLALLSGMFFTLSSAAVKALRSVDPMELLVIRSTVQVACVLPVAICTGAGLIGPKGHRGLLQLQGIVGALTLVMLFFSFRRLPLGDATTIIFSSPVFVLILSFLFLREPCGFFRTLVVCMLLTGVVLISKPPFIFQTESVRQYDVVGYACALLATVLTAANIVVMRKCKDVHFSVVVLQLSLWALLISGVLLAVLGTRASDIKMPRGLWQWSLVGMVSVFGLSGQLLVARALSMEGAGKVAVTRSLDIVLAFILQVFAFGEVPDWMSIAGAVLVLVCVLGMGLESQLHRAAARVP